MIKAAIPRTAPVGFGIRRVVLMASSDRFEKSLLACFKVMEILMLLLMSLSCPSSGGFSPGL
jgi:hypothetical protein